MSTLTKWIIGEHPSLGVSTAAYILSGAFLCDSLWFLGKALKIPSIEVKSPITWIVGEHPSLPTSTLLCILSPWFYYDLCKFALGAIIETDRLKH